ncbi:MAG TPA: ankyrin repeat domain-containing protein [Fimbriimonadaceae bacterium]|nr:ankyrin repeat domain-containing protein [Fimbriimonadaceae bacterium]
MKWITAVILAIGLAGCRREMNFADAVLLLERSESDFIDAIPRLRRINGTSEEGLTLLHMSLDKPSVMRSLLEHGANPEVRDKAGWTPLHLACSMGRSSAAEALLSFGADAHDPSPEEGWYPIHAAAHAGSKDCIQLLYRYGAEIEAKTRMGLTPLHVAVRELKPEAVEDLLHLGANRRAKDVHGHTVYDSLREVSIGAGPSERARAELIAKLLQESQ